MTEKIKSWIQEIEDFLRYRLVWDPKSKIYKKMIVYREEDFKDGSDGPENKR
jgi:hypothetical protein